MNLKALITTLVLGSSSAAMADSFSLHGSVKVSVGGGSSVRSAPLVHAADCADPHDNRPAPRRAYTAPAYNHQPVVVRRAPAPVIRGPWYQPTNTTVGATASQYNGWIAKSPTSYRMVYGKALVMRGHTNTSWFDLTAATRIDSGREFFKIGAAKGVFQALKLQALGAGRSHIKQVAIEFLDAQGRAKTQKVVLNTWISPQANPQITIDLEGGYRSINRIIVYGSTDRGSAYKILAM